MSDMQQHVLKRGKTTDGANQLLQPVPSVFHARRGKASFHLPDRFLGRACLTVVCICGAMAAARPGDTVAADAPVTVLPSSMVANVAETASAPTPVMQVSAPFYLATEFAFRGGERAQQDPKPDETPDQEPEKPAGEGQTSEPEQDKNQKTSEQERPMTERERMIAEANRRRLEEKEVRPDKPEIRRTAVAGEPIELTFDDIKFDMDKNEDFQRSMLTDEIKSYHGKVVRLRGFIRPGARQENLSRFVFVRDDKECCFGPGAAIYDCVLVQMHPDHLTDFTVRPITLEGQFYLKEYKGPDGRVWAIYRMKNARRL